MSGEHATIRRPLAANLTQTWLRRVLNIVDEVLLLLKLATIIIFIGHVIYEFVHYFGLLVRCTRTTIIIPGLLLDKAGWLLLLGSVGVLVTTRSPLGISQQNLLLVFLESVHEFVHVVPHTG